MEKDIEIWIEFTEKERAKMADECALEDQIEKDKALKEQSKQLKILEKKLRKQTRENKKKNKEIQKQDRKQIRENKKKNKEIKKQDRKLKQNSKYCLSLISPEVKKDKPKTIQKRKILQGISRDNKKEYMKEYCKKYFQNNKKELYKKQCNRRLIDPLFKLTSILRSRVGKCFKVKKWRKNKSTLHLLGCDFITAKSHIESQFKEGMRWDNHAYNGWHVDHIIPLASAKSERELIPLFHYTNLQPLWAKENMRKGDSLPQYTCQKVG